MSSLVRTGKPPTTGTYVVPAPTGTFAGDWNNTMAALAAASTVQFQPGTYLLYNVVVPDDRHLVIPAGTTIKIPDNTATAAVPYRIFTGSGLPPTNIRFTGAGLIDGNRRGGNHGLSENILGIDLADAVDVTVEGLRFYNWRGEGCYFGHVTTWPTNVKILDNRFEDCGVKETGDSGNPRQGVAFVAGQDLLIAGNSFDVIGAYAVDLEGNGATDSFDNCVIGPNVYRGCVQGPVNVIEGAGAPAPTNIDIRDRVANGSLGISGTFVKPAALKNIQTWVRTAGDLTLNPGDTNWHDLPTVPTLVLQGVRAGDLIEVGVQAYWDDANTYRNLDVASIVSSAPVTYWGAASGTPGVGVPSWRGEPATVIGRGGSVFRTVSTSDIAVDGSLTLRFRYSLNAATISVLSAAVPPLHAWCKNHGATP